MWLPRFMCQLVDTLFWFVLKYNDNNSKTCQDKRINIILNTAILCYNKNAKGEKYEKAL